MLSTQPEKKDYLYSIEDDDGDFYWVVFLLVENSPKELEDGFAESHSEAFSEAKKFAEKHFESLKTLDTQS